MMENAKTEEYPQPRKLTWNCEGVLNCSFAFLPTRIRECRKQLHQHICEKRYQL